MLFPANLLASTTTPPRPFYGPFFGTTRVSMLPQENFWILWCKGRLREADTLTIRLGATPSGLTSAHLYHFPISWLVLRKQNRNQAKQPQKYAVNLG